MTPEQQRIAIAEACGWVDIQPCTCKLKPRGRIGQDEELEHIPNYCYDLNAIHEAEKVLTADDMNVYLRALKEMVGDTTSVSVTYSLWEVVCATAAQRAEAFLKTIGKWTDQ